MVDVELAAHVEDRSPRGIAAAVARLVHAGSLRPGDRLPTVRALAAQLQVSPATVGSAWQALAAVGLVHSRGRAGTQVLPVPEGRIPPRYRDLAGDGIAFGGQPPGSDDLLRAGSGPRPAPARFDLSSGTPDPALLPQLGPSLARVSARTPAAETVSYVAEPLVSELESLLRATWPFVPQRLTVVDGAIDAMARVLEQVTSFGDRVAVEDPGFPPLFDLLDHLGLERVPVALDRSGIRPESLADALATRVRAIVVQPRAQNPTGVSLHAGRVRELATLLRGSGVWVVEDDHSGEISSARDVSIGSVLPDCVVHVRSYSKSHGPDLRIAAVGGPAQVLDGLVARRMLGPGWTSRLLQRVLADLLTDGAAVDAVGDARRVYHARQRALTQALAARGLVVEPGDGVNLWLPVHDEQTALVRLAAAGIRVAPGRPFSATGDGAPHVRVTVAALGDRVEAVARALAVAAAP